MTIKKQTLFIFLLSLFLLPSYGVNKNNKIKSKELPDSLKLKEVNIEKKDTLQESVVYSKQILGSKFKARNRTGSAYYISPEEILKMGYTDLNRMLKAVPGVNMYEEDGFGLRPNISLRGTKAERSERISIMEDGILAAPAPYSAPAAYYFPNAARMQAVEVLKGSSQVQYGPFTTGGAINMVSIQIPNKFLGYADVSYGSFNTLKSHLYVGNMWKHIGFLVEGLRYQSDGFKKFNNLPKGYHPFTGFKRNDFLAKVLFRTNKDEGVNHNLELKFGYADEYSDETYVGLSEADFKKTPYLRYDGTQKDNLKTYHRQYVATYIVTIPYNIYITTNLYYNRFHRNWYKLNDIKIQDTPKKSITDILLDASTNERYYKILTGAKDNSKGALLVKANNRYYVSKGIQTKIEYNFSVKGVYVNLEYGLRLHYDEEDRSHWLDRYSMENREMKLFLKGGYREDANMITHANAIASYGLAKVRYNNLTLTAGLRFEDVDLLKKNYTTKDTLRTGKQRIETPNHARAWIPGIGINYQLHRHIAVFAGIHKGFAPPSAELNQKPESSTNLEAGLRLNTHNLTTEIIGFYNHFSNMLGSDLAATGGSGTLEQFNVGKAKVKGLEFLAQYQPLPQRSKIKLPIQLSYTYTDTKMLNSFESNAWGHVKAGDEIPYIFKHSLNVQLGIEHKKFNINIGGKYNADMRTTPGQGKIANREKVPATFILDGSAAYIVNKNLTIKVNAINLTNKVYLASRHPAGLRAGHPFGIYGGFTYRF